VSINDAPPSSLMDSIIEGVGARSLACNIFRVEGCVGVLGWD